MLQSDKKNPDTMYTYQSVTIQKLKNIELQDTLSPKPSKETTILIYVKSRDVPRHNKNIHLIRTNDL